GGGVGSAVRFNEANDDIDAAAPEVVRFVEHPECLSNAGCETDVQFELSALASSDELEKIGLVVHGLPHRLDCSCHFLKTLSSAILSSNTLTRGSPKKPNCRPSTCRSS